MATRWLQIRVLLALTAGCGPPATVEIERSLIVRGAAEVDASADAPLITFPGVWAGISDDGHGGRMLDGLLRAFARTAHSERAGPAQLADVLAAELGADPATWDMARLPFRVTALHNRLDLAGGEHCGELRVSLASTHAIYQPLHLLLIFRQPAGPGDRSLFGLTCEATAREWTHLSSPEGEAWREALSAKLRTGLARERFALLESLEFTVAPWEWRQWVPASGEGGLRFENPPLLQTVDVATVNPAGPLRERFLAFVRARAAQLNEGTAEIPDEFRAPSARVNQGVPRVALSLAGLEPSVLERFPALRERLELQGCPACHTSDAEFVQTRLDRSVSPFYEKELRARAAYLGAVAGGAGLRPRFGPLQAEPVLPR